MFRLRLATLAITAALFVSACGSSIPTSTGPSATANGAASTTTPNDAGALGSASTPASGQAASTAVGAATAVAGTTGQPVPTRTVAPSGAATSPTAAGRATAAAKPAVGSSPLTPGGFGNIDACKLVTKAEATALLGAPAQVSGVVDSVSDGSFSQSCMYSVGGGAVGAAQGALGASAAAPGGQQSGTIMVQFYPAAGATWFKHDQNNDTKVESTIGDQYYLNGVGRAGNTQSGGITVLKGASAVGVSVLTEPSKALSPDQYKEIARNVVTRLPGQASGPAPAAPKFVPGTPTAVPAPAAPTAAIPAVATPSPALNAVSASIQAALQAAQAGDLAKARAAYAQVSQQWAAIPNDGKLVTPEIYTAMTEGIKQTDGLMANGDTDAAAAASALSDLSGAVEAAAASGQAAALVAAIAPQLASAMGTAVAMPTPIAQTADQNPACALLTKAEADAVLGGSSEVQSMPTFDSSAPSCRYVVMQTASATASTPNPKTCTAVAGGQSCVGLADAVDITKVGLISVDMHVTGGANWYAENEQRINGYRSGADIGDQFFAMGAQQIYVLKGDTAISITMPPFHDFAGTPIEEMKGLATKAAGRMH